jgi:hypothetical protein
MTHSAIVHQADQLLLVPATRCDRCPSMPGLLAVTRVGRLCRDCWMELPEPLKWLPPSTMQETHWAEVKARERMTARGGTDRHLVRAGLS